MTLSVSHVRRRDADPKEEPSIVYVRATPGDARRITSFFQAHAEVAFCDWQRPDVTRHQLTLATTIAYLALDSDGVLIGVILGGVMGTRGTVNHLAVARPFRARGVGKALFGLFREELRGGVVRRLFVFVADRNTLSQRFWQSMDFKEILHETTLECDI